MCEEWKNYTVFTILLMLQKKGKSNGYFSVMRLLLCWCLLFLESTSQQVQNLSKEADLIKQKLDSNPVQTKLQLLQERQRGNRILSTNDHHPSFANHFGFRYRADPFFVRNNRRIMNNYKVQVTKSKSSDSQTYR